MTMHKQHAFIMDQIKQGRTVLAYDRRIPRGKVHHLTDADRVSMRGDVLHVDGKPAKGWTICVKL